MSDLTPSLTKDKFEEEVLKSGTPVLVDFWAEWCGPCRMLGPVLEEIAPQFQGKVKIVKMNVDQNSEVAAKYGVMSIPTMILFKNGEELDRMTGALPKTQIISHIEKVLEG